jgi:FMN hydrolase / 5-amino-6-(5-phospho-D-ribitylamino)uracil phosphatase
MDAAVLFDFGGTLDADGLPWKERFFRLCVEEGVAVERGRFDPVFYAADDALVGRLPDTLSIEETVGRLAAGVVGALQPGDGALAARVADRFLAAARQQIERNRPMLTRLSSRYHLGIVSNFYGNLPEVCANLHIRSLFRVIVDSSQVGVTKPDPRIFRRAVEALGVPLARAVFVGDSPARDMVGARGVGMRHIRVAGDEAQSAQPCCPGDRVVRVLEEVEALL